MTESLGIAFIVVIVLNAAFLSNAMTEAFHDTDAKDVTYYTYFIIDIIYKISKDYK
jgi:hypothetical protein